MAPRQEFAATVIAGAAASGVALFAASRTWVVETVTRPAPLPPTVTGHSGGALVPALPALALVALAAMGALLATRGRVRLLVGVLVAACGLGVFVAAFAGFDHYPDASLAWSLLAMAAGLVIAGAGMNTLRHSARWPAMGARYERGGAGDPATAGLAPDATPAQWWDAIDRGQDPTAVTGSDADDAADGDPPTSAT